MRQISRLMCQKVELLPGSHLVENFKNLLDTVDIVPALTNSAIISITTTILSLIIASLAGYGFEVYRSKAKDIVFNILLLSMMIPFAALMVPLYRMFGSSFTSATIHWNGYISVSYVTNNDDSFSDFLF